MNGPTINSPTLLWQTQLLAPPLGLSLARERNWLLAWDKGKWLYLFNQAGKSQAQRQFPSLLAACSADDASAYGAISRQNKVWWLAPDLMARWEKSFSAQPLAVAMDPFGQYLAVSLYNGEFLIFDRQGRQICGKKMPRSFHHLAFIPNKPLIVGCADYGLVAGVTFQGELLWRDSPVANVGSISSDGEGDPIILACYSEGLQSYDAAGKKLATLSAAGPSRLVSQSFDGNRILVAGLKDQITLLNRKGDILSREEFKKPLSGIQIDPLGKVCFAAFGEGICKLRLPKP